MKAIRRKPHLFTLIFVGIFSLLFSGFVQAEEPAPTDPPSLLADIFPGEPSSSPTEFTELNNKLYFTAGNLEGIYVSYNIWVYDPWQPPSEANPTQVTHLPRPDTPGYDPLPSNLITIMGKLFFNYDGDGHGDKMWVYDPALPVSDQNPKTIEAYQPGDENEYYVPLYNLAINNKIYFTNSECSGSAGLHSIWEFDPALDNSIGENPKKVFTLLNDNCGDSLGKLTYLDGKIYFTNSHPSYGREIWSYDLSQPTELDINPKLLFEIVPGDVDDYVGPIAAVGDLLFFQADDDRAYESLYGRELYVYDPSIAIGSGNPEMVIDLNPGSDDAYPSDLTDINGNVFFKASDGEHGYEYWIYDPNLSVSASNPQLIADINPGTEDGATNFAYEPVPQYEGKIFFQATDDVSGKELWEFDLTQPTSDTNPHLVFDIFPGFNDSSPMGFFLLDKSLYFSADNGEVGAELWKYDLSPCYTLQTSHTGNGANPIASPTKSDVCTNEGEYLAEETITLTASPDDWWEVYNWNGTDKDASQELNNVLTMPNGNHVVSVHYQSSDVTAPSGGFNFPKDNGSVVQPRTMLEIHASDDLSGVKMVTFFAYYNEGWHDLGSDIDGSNGWQFVWPTQGIPEQSVEIKAVIEDAAGNQSQDIIVSNITLTRYIVLNNGFTARENSEKETNAQDVDITQITVIEQDTPKEINNLAFIPTWKSHLFSAKDISSNISIRWMQTFLKNNPNQNLRSYIQ